MNILIISNNKSVYMKIAKAVIGVKTVFSIKVCIDAMQVKTWSDDEFFDVVFLEIEFENMNGIDLGEYLKDKYPRINLIYISKDANMAVEVFALRCSGFLMEPFSGEQVVQELKNLRYPVTKFHSADELTVECFGMFKVYYNQRIVKFRRKKTKELLALLIDRQGAKISSGEICARLFDMSIPDKQQKDYFRHLIVDLREVLKKLGKEEIFIQSHNGYSIIPDGIGCDYYDYLKGIPYAKNIYQGLYMEQYDWAEDGCMS